MSDDTESRVVQKKFSEFSVASGEGIEGVGLKGGQNVRFALTTDAVAVNPNPFRDAKGRYALTPTELENINNQRDVNEFLYEKIQQVEGGEIDLDGYATEEQLQAVDDASVVRDDALNNKIEQESNLNSVAHLKLEDQIQWLDQHYQAGDQKLQDQIDGIDVPDLSDVEDRLDGIEAALPGESAQPVDIGTQVLKITGSRPTGAAGEAGNMLCWKAAAGTGGSPYNEIKFVVPDTSAIDLSANQMWLVQGDVIQRWETAGGGWFTNNNVLHVSGLLTEGDDLVDGQPVEMYYSDPAAKFLDAISKEESKADDRRLQAEIEQVALGLETLLTQRTHGQWKYIGFSGDNIPRNEGEFSLASDDLSAQDNIITINLTDLNGMTIGLSDVGVGDYVEIVDLDEPANYVLFACTKAPEGTGISNIEVALKDKGNNFLIGDACEIRFFSINQENIDLSELDARYLKLSGGTMNAGKAIFVDQIEPVDNTRYIRYEAGRDKRYPFALANCGMVQDVAKEVFDEEIAKIPASGSVGRRFTFTWAANPSEGYFSFNGQQIIFAHADLNGVIRKHTSEDFTWDTFARMTIWDMEGEICYAAELSKSTDYSTTVMRFYRESVKLDRVLEAGKDYDITVEGYW